MVKINFFLLRQAQISELATRARVMPSLDWLAFAVKPVSVDSCIWKIAQGIQSNESVIRARVASTEVCA